MKFVYIFIIVISNLWAHPHVFVVASTKFIVKENKITGININWEWDEMWSQDILNECDLNFDGKFDKKEIDLVNKDWFSTLKSGDYFTKLIFNNKEYKITSISSFKASITKYNTVAFDFVCNINPLSVSSPVNAQIIFEDPTTYISFDEYFTLSSVPKFTFKNKKTKETFKYGINTSFDIIYGGK